MTTKTHRSPLQVRYRFRPTLERLEDRSLLSTFWGNFAGNPQHTGQAPVATQPIDAIHWQASIDLNPGFVFAHYGSPVVTPSNTVVIPVKTGAFGGFELTAVNGTNGSALWTNTSDYTLPPFSWMPPFGPALTPSNRLYFPGNGGTVYYIDNPDTAGATITGQLAFFGIANYNANPGAYNSSVMIDTPITADNAGNIYFGFEVTGSNPSNLVGGGIARIDASGNGSWVLASTAANDANVTKVPLASAPALSADGSTLYVSVNNDGNYYGYLLGLNSTTLATQDKVFLKDPRHGNAQNAGLLDISTATPMVAPDGTVFYGIFGNPYNGSRGFLLHFSADLTREFIPGSFGWDDTASIVPASMVPSYHGTSSYLIFSKYNNYAFVGGDGVNLVGVLDPNATQPDGRNDGDPNLRVMNEVLTMPGPSPDFGARFSGFPNAVREWCINDTVIDPATQSILVNSEDGNVYRWNLATDSLTEAVHLTPGVGEPYVPTLVGADGTVIALNGGLVFGLGGLTNYTLTNTASVNPVLLNQSVTFTTTLASTSGGAVPTGTITYLDGSTTLGTATLTGGQATFTTSFASEGGHFITASYGGDPSYSPGSSQLIEMVRYGSTAVVGSSANPSVYYQQFNLTAVLSPVAPGTLTPTGKVIFMEGSTALGSAFLDSNGHATLNLLHIFSVGTHTFTINYVGDIEYMPSSSLMTQTINRDGTTSTVVSSANPSTAGQAVTFTATVTANAPGGGTPTGTVDFFDGATLLGSATLNAGMASFTTSTLSVGAHNISVAYHGSGQYVPSRSAVLVQTVNASSAIVLVASTAPTSSQAAVPLARENTSPAANSGIAQASTESLSTPHSLEQVTPGILSRASAADLDHFFALLKRDLAAGL
jgi:hypothetical protein